MDKSYVFKSGAYAGTSVVEVAYSDMNYLDSVYGHVKYVRGKIRKGLDIALEHPEKVQKLLPDLNGTIGGEARLIHKIMPMKKQSWVEWLVAKKEKSEIRKGAHSPSDRITYAVYKKANEEIARIQWEEGEPHRQLEALMLGK